MTTSNTHDDVTSICEALRIPGKDRHLFRRWTDRLTERDTHDQLNAYVDVMIADRCRRPGNDLLSWLIRLDVDGEGLSVEEIRGFVVAVLGRAATRRPGSRSGNYTL